MQPFRIGTDYDASTALSPRVRRDWKAVKRGIIEECCDKPCAMSILEAYCG